MKNRGGGARKSGQPQRQGVHCSNQNLGQGRGSNCERRRTQKGAGFQPMRSIISSVLLGIQRLAQHSRQKIAMISRNSKLLSDASAESGSPPLEYMLHKDVAKKLEDRNKQLITKNEKVQSTNAGQR